MASPKDLDLVLFGATGFTGQLVAERLAKEVASLRFGLAGRSLPKLERVRAALAKIDPRCADLPLLLADAADEAALAAVAARTRVICSTVGPYLKYGLPLLAACAAAGTDYCDLTGEVPFIRASIDRHLETARGSGARLLHACGFDSIPSDLGVFALHRQMAQRGLPLREARLFVRSAKGGFSGGTLATMLNLFEMGKADKGLRRMMVNPYALVPDDGDTRGRQNEPRSVRFDREAGQWTAPFVMAGINTRVVHRTNALLDYPYGRDFRYAEYVGFGRGPRAAAMAAAMMAGIAGFVLLSINDLTRPLLQRLLPQGGEGPSEEAREQGRWRVILRGFTDDKAQAAAVLKLSGEGDPGYASTARMLSEVALLLVETHGKAPGGVYTPAAAFGQTLVERLARAGVHFEFSDGESV
jgi:short subunit dehydrogenase-like uncharacterized protein